MKYPLKGKYQYGNVEYEIGKPFIARKDFKLLSGELKVYSYLANVGLTNECCFCLECGNCIYHVNPDKLEVIRFKLGTLEDTSVIQPKTQVWLKSKQDWIKIPDGVETYETQPVL